MIKVREVSQIERDGYHIIPLRARVYNDTNRFIYKRETDLQISKTNLWLPKGKRWRREVQG